MPARYSPHSTIDHTLTLLQRNVFSTTLDLKVQNDIWRTLSQVACEFHHKYDDHPTVSQKYLISFAINTQNFVGSARKARYYQDKICEILADIED